MSMIIDRELELEKIKRFKDYKIMHYRDNVLTHSRRVVWLLKDALIELKTTFPEFDGELALLMAEVHDDPEIIMGDITYKKKSQMTPAQLKIVEETELRAIEKITHLLQKDFSNVDYNGALYHVHRNDCIEAKIVKYFDKLEAMCACLHELHAGNKLFVEPFQLYWKIFGSVSDSYPDLRSLLGKGHPLLAEWSTIDVDRIIKQGHPFDSKNLLNRSGLPHYDAWKEILVRNSGMTDLINKTE